MSGSKSTSTSGSSGGEKIPPKRREEALERDRYSCVLCSAAGPGAGGTARLEVHHADPDPDDDDLHALSNLVTLCEDCHLWHHKRPDGDDVPFRLTAADDDVLDPTDYEILRYLANHGPAETSAIADTLTADLSPTAVRERLALLMGLDNVVDEREQQLIDQDVETGKWGLTEQIEHSARGHIPSEPQKLIQRVEDEQVRQALDRGCDRQAVMDILDVSRRSTFHKAKRARAYDLPLAALTRSGDGGQHPAAGTSNEETDEAGETGKTSERDATDGVDAQVNDVNGAAQRQPAAGEDTTAGDEQGDGDASGEAGQRGGNADDDGDDVVVREQLQAAITALQRINAEL